MNVTRGFGAGGTSPCASAADPCPRGSGLFIRHRLGYWLGLSRRMTTSASADCGCESVGKYRPTAEIRGGLIAAAHWPPPKHSAGPTCNSKCIELSAHLERVLSECFFFDLTNGLSTISDEVGVSAIDLDDAIHQAGEALAEMREDNELANDADQWMMIICNASGKTVRVVPVIPRDAAAAKAS